MDATLRASPLYNLAGAGRTPVQTWAPSSPGAYALASQEPQAASSVFSDYVPSDVASSMANGGSPVYSQISESSVALNPTYSDVSSVYGSDYEVPVARTPRPLPPLPMDDADEATGTFLRKATMGSEPGTFRRKSTMGSKKVAFAQKWTTFKEKVGNNRNYIYYILGAMVAIAFIVMGSLLMAKKINTAAAAPCEYGGDCYATADAQGYITLTQPDPNMNDNSDQTKGLVMLLFGVACLCLVLVMYFRKQ